MISHTIYKDQGHIWLAFGQDPDKPEKMIDTNQIVIVAGSSAIILDPGGIEVFPPMLAALTDKVAIENIKHLFMSHQDPDIGSSLPLWRQVCNDDVNIYLSKLWTGFVAHLDAEAPLTPIPDEGMSINLGTTTTLEFIPAHYLHSSGNFSVYDPQARILWSGDIGASLLPKGSQNSFYVEDFDDHVQYMEGFHRRWMGSTRARDAWVERVSKMDVNIMTPQHGLFFKGDDIKRFLDWLGRLDIGSGIDSMRGGGVSRTLVIEKSPAAAVTASTSEPKEIPEPASEPETPADEPAETAADEPAQEGGYTFPEA